MGVFILGADVGGTNIRTALLNLNGEVLGAIKRPTLAHKGREALIRRLVIMLRDTARGFGADMERVAGIGVGFPGPLDAEKGIVFNPPNLPGWVNVPLKDILEEELGRPVALENDANAAAFGEHWRGAGRGTRSLVCLTLGTGVGGGIILDGRIWHGAMGIAGEIGHMTIVRNGPRCNCGNRGCLEVYCSSRGMITRMEGLVGRRRGRITLERIGQWARKGDQTALRTIKETGVILGIGIASIANLLNPETVVLSGGISNLGEHLLVPVREEIKKRALPQAWEGLKIVRAELGDNAGVIGAARCVLERFGP